MKRQTRSILQELESISLERDTQHIVESRGAHIIASAVNFIEKMYESYDEEVAKDLERKFLNSIKNKDPKKFQRSVRRNNEN